MQLLGRVEPWITRCACGVVVSVVRGREAHVPASGFDQIGWWPPYQPTHHSTGYQTGRWPDSPSRLQTLEKALTASDVRLHRFLTQLTPPFRDQNFFFYGAFHHQLCHKFRKKKRSHSADMQQQRENTTVLNKQKKTPSAYSNAG